MYPTLDNETQKGGFGIFKFFFLSPSLQKKTKRVLFAAGTTFMHATFVRTTIIIL